MRFEEEKHFPHKSSCLWLKPTIAFIVFSHLLYIKSLLYVFQQAPVGHTAFLQTGRSTGPRKRADEGSRREGEQEAGSGGKRGEGWHDSMKETAVYK